MPAAVPPDSSPTHAPPSTLAGALRWLAAPAHWCGLGLASGVLGLQALGWVGVGVGWALAAGAFATGFALGGLWWGWPSTRAPAWEVLAFKDEGDTRQAMELALSGVRRLTEHNPEGRIPSGLQARVQALCQALEALLLQWERSRGSLSLEDSFHARHIAIRYLPEALNSYLAIPAAYATTRVLGNGQTAQQTFAATLAELEAKVRELADDLAAQDAQAFLNHSTFLRQKFGPQGLDAPALNLPAQTQPGPAPAAPRARSDGA